MSVTAQYVLYKSSLEPIVKIDDFVAVRLGENRFVYGRVVYIEPIPATIVDLGPLEAGKTGETKTLDGMKLGDGEFGQWQIDFLDDFALIVKLPSAIPKGITREGETIWSPLTPQHLRRIYTWEDDMVPTVTPVNQLPWSIEAARIVFYGFRYVIDVLEKPPEHYTVIPVAGQPPRGVR